MIPEKESPAIISDEGRISYKEYRRKVLSLAKRLELMGIKEGDRVGIISENSPEFIILILSLIHLGAVSVPINVRWTKNEMYSAIKEVDCRFLILSKRYRSVRIPEVKIYVLEELISEESPLKEYEVSYKRDATVIFTSGTSGRPKGVLHTLENHYYSAVGSNMNIRFSEGDVWAAVLPFYHIGGLSIIFRAIFGGGAVAVSKSKDIADLIDRLNITHISFVPTQLYRLLKDKRGIASLKRLKAILIGGSSVNESLIRRSYEIGLRIYTTYGLTEMASQVTTTRPNDSLDHLLTSGRLLPYRELKIAEDGEILVKGKTLFKGYLKGKRLERNLTDDGWFRTKDLGSLDKDGYLRVYGRKDNMFISGGENIQPEEIERVLNQYDGIIESVVVPVEDKEWGQRPVAFVDSEKKIDEKRLKKWLENYLSKYKIPDRIFPVPKEMRGMKLSRERFKELARRIMERDRS